MLTVLTRAGQLVCAVVLTRLVRHALLGHPQEVPNLQLADLELDTCVLKGTEWRRKGPSNVRTYTSRLQTTVAQHAYNMA